MRSGFGRFFTGLQMNRTAIVSAMHEELATVLGLMPDEQKSVVAGREFWLGHLHGHEVVAVLSGIGKVAAATTATVLIEHFGVRRILFTGVAGGLGADVRVGDVIVASQFMQHDLDVSPLFPRYEVPGYGIAVFDADPGLTAALGRAVQATLADLPHVLLPGVVETFGLHAPRSHHGLLISGDRFVATTSECRVLQQALPEALAVEMEGAPFAQVCRDYGIPFAAVRTVSDRADDAAHVDFLEFLRQVASRYSWHIIDSFFRLSQIR
jgi:adenosylhomocysteine nucleosidase